MSSDTEQASFNRRNASHLQNAQNMLAHGTFMASSYPKDALKLLKCTQEDLNYNKAWIFMMSRKLKYQDAEEVAFQACSALLSLMSNSEGLHQLIVQISKELPKDEREESIMQILSSCCLHIVAKLASSENITNLCDYIRMMKLEGALHWSSLSQIEKLVFISLYHHPFGNLSPQALFFEMKKGFAIQLKIHDKSSTKEEDVVEDNFCKVILKTVYCNSSIDTVSLAVGTLKFLLRQYSSSAEQMLTIEKKLDSLLEAHTIDQSNKVVKDVYGILLLETSNSRSIKSLMEGLLPHADSITAALSIVKLNVLAQMRNKN